MTLESYGIEKYYATLKHSCMYLMRFIRYRSPKKNETNIGHLPHRDKSFMGIIDTNQVGGLEMETRDGKWITFQPSSYKTLVIIAGEPFMVRITTPPSHFICHLTFKICSRKYLCG